MEERGYNHKRGGTSLCEFVNSVWHEISLNVINILQLRQVGTCRGFCENMCKELCRTQQRYIDIKFGNLAELPPSPPFSSSSSPYFSSSLHPFLDFPTSVFTVILFPRFHLPKLHIIVLIRVLYIATSSVLYIATSSVLYIATSSVRPCDDQCNSSFRTLPPSLIQYGRTLCHAFWFFLS